MRPLCKYSLRFGLLALCLSLASLQAQPVVTGSVYPDPLGFGQNVQVGLGGSPGSITISGGIGLTNLSTKIGDDTDNSAVTVSGTGSTLTSNGTLYVGTYTFGPSSSNNTLTVSDGGTVTSFFGTIRSTNTATVSGMGSTWATTNSASPLSLGGTLTVEDSALVRAAGGLSFGVEADSLLRLDGGFVALLGDKTTDVGTFLTNGNIQVWDGDSWENASGNPLFSFAYFTDGAAALAATGYSGLAGYTILSMVPEPSTYALTAGLLGLGLAALRRKKR